jgi:hypothetical protein
MNISFTWKTEDFRFCAGDPHYSAINGNSLQWLAMPLEAPKMLEMPVFFELFGWSQKRLGVWGSQVQILSPRFFAKRKIEQWSKGIDSVRNKTRAPPRFTCRFAAGNFSLIKSTGLCFPSLQTP